MKHRIRLVFRQLKLAALVARVAYRQGLSLRLVLPLLKLVSQAVRREPELRKLFQQAFDNYLGNVSACALGRRDVRNGAFSSPVDLAFLREIEESSVTPAQSDRFRTEVLLCVSAYVAKQNAPAPYTVHQTLSRAVENYVVRRLLGAKRQVAAQ